MVDRALLKRFEHVDIVKKVEGEDVIYLRRYFIYTSKEYNVYLHHIRRSDDDPDPHDHPWDFWTFLLWGWYFDVHPGEDEPVLWFAHRKAEHVHQVKLVNGSVWSLVITGPYRREWGFVTPNGWVMWRKYLGIGEGNPYDKVTL